MRSQRRVTTILALVICLMSVPVGSRAAGPTNDAFRDARAIAALPFAEAIDTTSASLEPGEPKPGCAVATASVWYRLAFPSDTSIRIQTSGSTHDSMLAIYRGDQLPLLTESACNDEFVRLAGGPSRILFTARGAVTYHVQVSAAYGGSGTMRVSFDQIETPPTLAAELPFETRASDGTPLRGHVLLPNGPGPFATVLELSPYWNTNYIASADADVVQEDRTTVWAHLGPYFDAGFAVALVNMRGSGKSEGCMRWGDRVDAEDAATVVDALGTQPWSNGSVGMVGMSFPGWSQYLAVAGGAEHLKAIVPADGVIDLWSLLTRNGAALAFGPTVMPQFEGFVLRGGQGNINALVLGGRPFVPDNSPSQVACPRYGEDTLASIDSWTNGDRNAYWDDRDLRSAIERSDVPIFVTNGLNTNGEGHILQVEGLWDIMPAERRMMLGQWSHGYPTRDDFPDLAIGWLDQYLRRGQKTVQPGVVEYQDSSGAWNTAHRWPPAASAVPLRLSDGALILRQNDVVPSTQSFVSTDVDPAPFTCPDRAIYVSPPLAEDVLIAGNALVDLTVSSTYADGNLSAFLWHTAAGAQSCPDGVPHGVNGAMAWNSTLAAYPDEVTRALTGLRQRDRSGIGSPMPVGVPTSVQISSHPFATLVRAGERLVLGIGGGSYELMPDVLKPVLTISTGDGLDGSISLPVVRGTLRFAD